MEPLLMKLADTGLIGIMLALTVYNVFYLQRKLISVVENNTAAMTELKSHCESRERK